jgi:tRNA A-37 threonylcarbamoyl transferase component Bud32/tetratricopeptide (TPR) repeat protein
VTLNSGARLGSYEVTGLLGAGGMGEVYRARDPRLNRDVALKVLPAALTADPAARERLRREAIAAAGLDHPFICKVFEIGEAGGRLFVVMELIEGETLQSALMRGPLAVARLVTLALELAEALEAAHGRRILHRDLKPSNIMLTAQHVKVLDFGLAKAIEDPDSDTRTRRSIERLTDPGVQVGTLAYMSPEQIAGDNLDARSDIFSLGVVLAELLTGRHPFDRPTTSAMITAVLNDPPLLQPPAATPTLHPTLRAILLRMLAKSPSERYGTIAQVRADLQSLDPTRLDSGLFAEAVPGGVLQQKRRWPMIGRHAERADLVAALERALNRQGGVVLIGGEPGIGKTRLTEEILIEARRRGASPVVGHCYEMQGAPPYVPFVEITEHTSRIVPREALRRLLGDDAAEVARLLPELRQIFPDLPPPIDLPQEQKRWFFFNAFKNFVDRACRLAPIVAVFEDLHWADEPTLQLLTQLAAPAGSMGLLIVGTYRNVELDATRPFAATLESLLRQRLASRITLRRLPPKAVESLLSAMSGRDVPESLSRAVFRETEGNPFFVEEVFQHLAEENRLFDAAGEWRRDLKSGAIDVPEGVRLVIGRRLERLGEETRTTLTTAALIGRSFSLPLLESLETSARPDAVLEAIEEAERAQLVMPNTVGRETHYMFAHELVRQTLADRLSLPRRQRLHLRVATAMESLYAASREKHATALAHHFYHAGAEADPDRTMEYLAMATRQAFAAAAYEDALTLIDNALSLCEGDHSVRTADLLVLRSQALDSLGRRTEAINAGATSAALYLDHGKYNDYARIKWANAIRRAWGLDTAGALRDLDDALAVAREHATEHSVHLLYARAHILGVQGNVSEAVATLRIAETRHRELGDPLLKAGAVLAAARVAWHVGNLGLALELGRQATAQFRALGRRWEALESAWLYLLELFVDQGRAAIPRLNALIDEACHFGHYITAWALRNGEVWFDVLSRTATLATIEDQVAFGITHAIHFEYLGRIALALHEFLEGESEMALRRIRSIAEVEPPGSWSQMSRGTLFFMLAHTDPDEARHVREIMPATLPSGDGPSAMGTWMNLGWTVLGLHALGDRGEIAALDPFASTIAVHSDPDWVGFFPRGLICGITATAAADWSRAQAALIEAQSMIDRRELRMFAGLALEAHADMLTLRNETGDRGQAAALYDKAATAYERDRLVPFVRRLAGRQFLLD